MRKNKYVMSYTMSSGWYILQDKSIPIRCLDGSHQIIRPYHIVQLVERLDNECFMKRLWRRITGRVLIKLPPPATDFAVIDKKALEANFNCVREPRCRWR